MDFNQPGKGITSLTLSKPSKTQKLEMFYFLGHHQYKLHILVQCLFLLFYPTLLTTSIQTNYQDNILFSE